MFTLIGRLNRDGLAILLVEQNVVQSLADRPPRLCAGKRPHRALGQAASELAEHPGMRKSYLGHQLRALPILAVGAPRA